MSKNKSKEKNKIDEISRIQVKDGFDPLVQIKSNEKDKSSLKKIPSLKSDIIITNEKNYIGEKLFDPLNNEISHSFDLNSQMSLSLEKRSNNINANVNKNETTISTKKDEESLILNKNNNDVLNKANSNQKKMNNFDLKYIIRNCNMLKSESIVMYENAIYRNDETEKEGILVITEYRLIFMFSVPEEEYIYLRLLSLNKLDRSNDKKNVGKYFLEIMTKDNRTFKFYILKDEQQKLYQHLLKYENPKEISIFYKFAYKYRESHPVNNDGWNIYDPLLEFERQGLHFENKVEERKKLRLVINTGFSICESYPEFLVIPNIFTDEDLSESRNFRTKNRIPVLTWMNSNNGATLWRSSQTRGGITQQRCLYDERLLKLIGELGANRLIIFDARPYLNALANRLKGAGYENTDNYHNTEIHFCEIDNIHCVRSALVKMHSLCKDHKIHENKKFLAGLEQTLWIDFIHLILKSASEITSKLTKMNSVLIHCSDGWDRSTQLVTLSQIMLDPYFRTIEGFIVLIEKDWLSYGHQFALRNGIYAKETNEEQKAPIFFQWLDCIHQLQTQFKYAFEFNNELLQFLAEHSNSCLYGTFLYNSEKERRNTNAKMKTVSIWTDVLENIELYKNIFYSKDDSNKILFPNFALYKLRFWEEYFLKFNSSYLNNLKRTVLSDTLNSALKPSFFEYNKKEDINKIESQRKKIDIYEATIKEFCKIAIANNIINELSDESIKIISKIVNLKGVHEEPDTELIEEN